MARPRISPNQHEVLYAQGTSNNAVPVTYTTGIGVDVNVAGGTLGGGLVTVQYDTVMYTNTSTTVDTYVYKTGGTGGTTVATVTITYTDTTKTVMSTTVKT